VVRRTGKVTVVESVAVVVETAVEVTTSVEVTVVVGPRVCGVSTPTPVPGDTGVEVAVCKSARVGFEYATNAERVTANVRSMAPIRRQFLPGIPAIGLFHFPCHQPCSRPTNAKRRMEDSSEGRWV
jgi:hypothetical protein